MIELGIDVEGVISFQYPAEPKGDAVRQCDRGTGMESEDLKMREFSKPDENLFQFIIGKQ
jgi:hypothetical protein